MAIPCATDALARFVCFLQVSRVRIGEIGKYGIVSVLEKKIALLIPEAPPALLDPAGGPSISGKAKAPNVLPLLDNDTRSSLFNATTQGTGAEYGKRRLCEAKLVFCKCYLKSYRVVFVDERLISPVNRIFRVRHVSPTLFSRYQVGGSYLFVRRTRCVSFSSESLFLSFSVSP